MKEFNIHYLVERYLAQQITPEELGELYAWVINHPEDETIKQALAENWLRYETDNKLSVAEADMMFNTVLKQAEGLHTRRGVLVIMRGWKRMVAAAAIMIVMLASTYFLFFNDADKPGGIVKVELPVDVKAPATNRATITLANGTMVLLDSATNGTLVNQGNVQLKKLADGQIAYTGSSQEVVYNTLTNPRGSKVINMTLSDGSRVWLNAGSSITYPIVFTGSERKVTITGEAYFEIEHDAAKPFIVSKGTAKVEVLGTHFNVNAYDDGEGIKVTLLEGSVAVSYKDTKNAKRITPGQQVILRQAQSVNGVLSIVNNVDLEEVMAWKNGVFQLKATGIETVMRQIARWYDVDVVYSGGPVKQVFYGTIPRTVSAANVFKVLEETGGVHFIIEERKVTVMP